MNGLIRMTVLLLDEVDEECFCSLSVTLILSCISFAEILQPFLQTVDLTPRVFMNGPSYI